MPHLFYLSAINVRHQRLVLAFFCLLTAQSTVAGDILQTDNAGHYSNVFAVVPSSTSGDTQSKPGDTPPNGHGQDAAPDDETRHARSPDGTTDKTTSHLTSPAKDAGQVIGYSHSTKLPKDGSQVAGYLPQAGERDSVSLREPHVNLRLRNSLIIGTGAFLVAAYGLSNWWQTGFGGGFRTIDEGWFGAETEYGGADKAGHLYSNYASVRLLTPIFESAGNSHDASVSLAAWSTLGIYTAVEVVDGFSRRWKFSPQDVIANATGAALGIVLETHPELDAIFDFRVDYRRSPRSSKFDPFGDYSEQKYLFVVKGDGFESVRENGFLRYFEVAVGYGTRGYDTGVNHQRNAYAGLSLNLARLLADGAYGTRMHSTAFQRGTDRVFDLVQFPTIGYVRRSVD